MIRTKTCLKMVEIFNLAYRELLREIAEEEKRADGPIKKHRLPKLKEKAEYLHWMSINETGE